MARFGKTRHESAIRVVLGPSVTRAGRFDFFSAGRRAPHPLRGCSTFAGCLSQVVGDQQMPFDDQDFLVADPALPAWHGVEMRCGGAHLPMLFTSTAGRSSKAFANALRFFRAGLPLLGDLNRRVGLGSGDDCKSHRIEIGRQLAVLGVEADVVVGILVCGLFVEHGQCLTVEAQQSLIVALILPTAAGGVWNRLKDRAGIRRRRARGGAEG